MNKYINKPYEILLDDINLTLLGYYPDNEFFWTRDEPFVTIHIINGKYIFSSTGKELNYVSDLQKEYFKFTNKILTF
jgi:hypothetical protein